MANKPLEEIADKVYDDVVHPVVKPIGEILGLFPRTLKALTAGWDRWLINREESLLLTAKAVEEKLENIPEEKICPPEPYIAIPAVQQLCYCQDSEELREMYANLLASSMNDDTKWKVHPSFVDIIKQLNPDEARLLRTMNNRMPCPLLDVRIVSPDAQYLTLVRNYTDQGADVLECHKNIASYIDNLTRLGLISVSGDSLALQQRYDHSIELCQSFHPVPPLTSDNWKREYIKKLFSLTDFGVNFVEVVVKNSE